MVDIETGLKSNVVNNIFTIVSLYLNDSQFTAQNTYLFVILGPLPLSW